ncbi:MAG TPA: hypothetical protein VJT50_11455 [Pyrinomonadaceae bacterium]|nr:hypothetical protein [Pyrinomonadaceae bacterium]
MTELIWSVLGLGFILGLKHALDPDHIVAVSTIVCESSSVRRSSIIGTMWGLGHTASLGALGFAVIGFKLRITDAWASRAELLVAFMLILLGLRTVLSCVREWKFHVHVHEHGGRRHRHLHVHRHGEEKRHDHGHSLRAGLRPFLIGLVHGMAGSAALTILVLSTIPSAKLGLIYIFVFGMGSLLGMLLTSTLLSLPFVFSRERFNLVNRAVQFALGIASVGFGLFLAYFHGIRPPSS